MKKVSPERAEQIAAYVRSHWTYNPETGCVFGRGGKPIGKREALGALAALVYLPGATTSVLLHRAAWLLHTGAWPDEQIDHINGDRADNRWCNLREATHGENRQNLAQIGKNGRLRGTVPHYRKFRAQIRIDGVHHYLGLFATEQEAHAAYCAAKLKLHAFNPVQRT